jgi:hypothetical protein
MGPGSLSFAWTVSSEPNADYFRFEIDDVVQTQISGNSGGNNIPWAQLNYAIPSGPHTLRWRYQKNESAVAGLDASYLDQVVYTPSFGSGPPYVQWLTTHFAASQWGNAYLTGPDADVDLDDRSNLDEYAFGGSPVLADSGLPVLTQAVGSEVFFDFSTDNAKTDLTVTPRLSSDLAVWTATSAQILANTGGRTFWRTRVPRSDGRKFFHLRATLVP